MLRRPASCSELRGCAAARARTTVAVGARSRRVDCAPRVIGFATPGAGSPGTSARARIPPGSLRRRSAPAPEERAGAPSLGDGVEGSGQGRPRESLGRDGGVGAMRAPSQRAGARLPAIRGPIHAPSPKAGAARGEVQPRLGREPQVPAGQGAGWTPDLHGMAPGWRRAVADIRDGDQAPAPRGLHLEPGPPRHHPLGRPAGRLDRGPRGGSFGSERGSNAHPDCASGGRAFSGRAFSEAGPARTLPGRHGERLGPLTRTSSREAPPDAESAAGVQSRDPAMRPMMTGSALNGAGSC